jgi:integrase
MAVATRKVVLTDRGLKALKPAPSGKRYIVWDAMQPHLGVRVTDKGVKSFIVVKRKAGAAHPDTYVLGQFPARALKAARDDAPGVISLLAQGKSPAQAKAEAAREAARRRADTFATAVEKFIDHEEGKGLRSWRETEAALRRDFLGQVPKRERKTTVREGRNVTEWVTEWTDSKKPAWRDRPIAEITRRDVIERLDEIKARRGKYAARHALSAMRKLFNWAEEGERFGLEESPAARIRDKTIGIIGKDLKRTRVLNDTELRDVWRAAGAAGYPFGSLVQLLMLTGQRLNDVAHAQRDEIDVDVGVLAVPPERFKTGVAQEVPLTARAVEIVKALPKFGDGYVFTTTGGARPISGISKMKAQLDRVIGDQRKADGAKSMPHWVLHDLRRTLRTRLTSDLDVDAFIAERVLGHALPGLHGVYDQGVHRAQKRAALEKWEAKLLSIVGVRSSAANIGLTEVERLHRRTRAW